MAEEVKSNLPAKNPFHDELVATARKIATRGKGILAADESVGTMGKRYTIHLSCSLKSINVENTKENRRQYRELLFTTEGLENHISGVILFDETLRSKTANGSAFLKDLLVKKGIVVGIKVDKGTRELPYRPHEKYTQGITDLDVRLKEYYKLGARFAKWRSVLVIKNGQMSQNSIRENAANLGRYASLCQWNGLVPIVEPEILMDGPHSVEVCEYWTKKVLAEVYYTLAQYDVVLEGTLLKPNMVLPGMEFKGVKNSNINAHATVRAMKTGVPPAVPGIVFLSGGQSEEQATMNLNAMNALYPDLPWCLSFSFGRALQRSCLDAYKGDLKNTKAAQVALMERAKANGDAQLGKYRGSNSDVSSKSLYEKGYSY